MLAIQFKLTECACAVRVPVSAIVIGEFVALLVTVTVPEALPAAAGVKVTLNGDVCPGDRDPEGRGNLLGTEIFS